MRHNDGRDQLGDACRRAPERAFCAPWTSTARCSGSLPFPFEGGVFPQHLGAVIQRTVLHGDEPVREVVHADDGSWLVGDGVHDPNEVGACVVSHIWHAIERNTSMLELAAMPPGHMATRSGPGDAWLVSPSHWPDDE